jgi:hypothetical protein
MLPMQLLVTKQLFLFISLLFIILTNGVTVEVEVAAVSSDDILISSLLAINDSTTSAASEASIGHDPISLPMQWSTIGNDERATIISNCNILRERLTSTTSTTTADARLDNMEAFEAGCIALTRGRSGEATDHWIAAQYILTTSRLPHLDELTRTTANRMASELLINALASLDDDNVTPNEASLRYDILQASSSHTRRTRQWSDDAVDVEWQLLAHSLSLPLYVVRPIVEDGIPKNGLSRIPSLVTALYQSDTQQFGGSSNVKRDMEDRLDDRKQAARQLISVAAQSHAIWDQVGGLEWLIVLTPSIPSLHAELSGVAYGYGQMMMGVQHAIMDVALQLQLMHDQQNGINKLRVMANKPRSLWHGLIDNDLITEVQHIALLMFSAGLETHTTSLARSMLLGERIATSIKSSCGYVDTKSYNGLQFTRQELIELLTTCLHRSIDDSSDGYDVIQYLLKNGGSVSEANFFGWTPLHHACSISDHRTVSHLLHAGADANAVTIMGQNALHIIAMRDGNVDVVNLLLRYGTNTQTKDIGGHTPIDLSWKSSACYNLTHFCHQLYDAHLGLVMAAGQPKFTDWSCKELEENYVMDSQSHRTEVATVTMDDDHYGGWSSTTSTSDNKVEHQCDIDVYDASVFTMDQFISDYLAIGRPVLVRGVFNGEKEKASWKRLLKTLTRSSMSDARLSSSSLSVGNIPYASSFGEMDNRTTFGNYLKYLSHQQTLSIHDRDNDPLYIFESLTLPKDYEPPLPSSSPSSSGSGNGRRGLSASSPLNNALLDAFMMPSFLSPDHTNITTRKVQFYLGPANSGAPVHFHRSAWYVYFDPPSPTHDHTSYVGG